MNENASNENGPGDKPKIVVDDDWKSQVEREKQELENRQKEQADSPHDHTQLPPASFQTLVSMLATQAMSALGLFPDPITQETHIDKRIAKHLIDTIGVLESKTKGNLDPLEAQMLEDVLHQLRILYVNAPDSQAEPPTTKKSQIELP
ncbi:MAG TPA: DUF1844 domain-containing protein [Pirellulaceae bacterium]|nr:DUF1844 domain-containing protein [Pirellulaceae bacterium]HMO94024.1 DUF1844 domain-containing protein [Pirellulaceae bacterium]HMP70785.1 DUF1844 domain-containing protein [Pirellulaceae bacterium]